MPMKKDPSTPPPMIGKIGPYTVFVTPPATPRQQEPVIHSPVKLAPPPTLPVQPPPPQFHKSVDASGGSFAGFLKNAASKVQNAHSSLDDHLSRWFGLDQSKYQWALDDYYESKGLCFLGVLTWITAISFLFYSHAFHSLGFPCFTKEQSMTKRKKRKKQV